MLMEHALWCHKTQIRPEVVHVRRANNSWADALANGNTKDCKPEMEIRLPEQPWLVWEELLRVAKK